MFLHKTVINEQRISRTQHIVHPSPSLTIFFAKLSNRVYIFLRTCFVDKEHLEKNFALALKVFYQESEITGNYHKLS